MNEEEYIENAPKEYSEEDITDSISGLLNDDLSINQETPEPPAPEPEEAAYDPALNVSDDYKVKVKVNGVEQEVSLEELRNGYQRQADYTQKTQELASQKNELTQQQREYQTFLESIPMLAQVATTNIQDATNRLYSPEFVQLASEDPAAYIAEKAKLERVINQNQQAAQQMQTQYQQHQQEIAYRQQQEFEQRLVQANEILTKEIEGWADGTAIDLLRNYATGSIGFNPHELDGLIDPRQVMVLDKARRYDELMKQNSVTAKKVQSVPSKTLRPGVASTTGEQDDFKQRQREVLASGNDRDIAAWMSQML